jgi:uncharacterized membrane protein
MITDAFEILIIFLGIIGLALFLTGRFKIAEKISPILLILIGSALLANLGIITTDNPFYGELTGYAVPFAVALILFHVRISDFKDAGLPMLVAFFIGSAGSLIGCVVGGMVLYGPFNDILAGEGWKLVGPYIGTYIGGSLNFFAMWTGLDINNPDLFAAANAVDNLTLLPIFLFWIMAPDYLMRFYKPAKIWHQPEDTPEQHEHPVVPLKIVNLAALSFWALLIMFLSKWIKAEFIAPYLPQLPSILILTTLALIAAQIKPIARLQGAHELGNFAFYIFFAAVGAMMDIPKAIQLAPVLFIFVSIIIVIQISLVLALGKLLRLDFRVVAIAAVAAKLGPSSVIALTNAKDWNALALPGVAAGLLGYAIGNYAGFAGAYLLKWIMG